MRTVVQLALASVALCCVACAWSVPSDPGENARRRRRPEPTAVPSAVPLAPGARTTSDPATAAVYAEKCGACHAPFPPTHATSAEWPIYVRRYGPRAGLFGAERARVLAWLQQNAR
jgi:hypothetical protein